MSDAFDVVVIGGGTAGLVTASGCSRLGRRVALIEKEFLGGDCLWTGCVPTKALVASAKLAHQMRTAGRWGLPVHDPAISPRAVMDSMRDARSVVAKHDDPEKFRKLGIDVISGDARFVSAREVDVAGRRLTAKDIVIATGSRTAVPPIEGLEEAGYITHSSFLDRDAFPQSIVILGGGYIGIEFAQIFRRFGAAVTVIEALDTIMPKEDRDIVARVRQVLESEDISIRTGWKVTRARSGNGMKQVTIENASGAVENLEAGEIFVATGRRGNIEGLDLEKAGVRTDRSWVVVDRFLQTSTPRIWACGDIHGGLQFTHVAAHEAVGLVRNILFPGKAAVQYEHVPWALYTDPEVARVGKTEDEARADYGDDVQTYVVEMSDVDRAVVDRTTAGFVKFICGRRGVILGAHIVASNASALIVEVVLARKKGVTLGGLAGTVSPYPSLSDAIQKAGTLRFQKLGEGWIGAVGRRIAAWAQ